LTRRLHKELYILFTCTACIRILSRSPTSLRDSFHKGKAAFCFCCCCCGPRSHI